MKVKIVYVTALLLLTASTVCAQNYRDINERVSHWFPEQELLRQTTAEAVEFRDADGKPLERVTGIFAFNNRLYVYDSATGHTYLFSANRRYLTQLTDSRHPINSRSGFSHSGEGYGGVISADPYGRVLMMTGSGMYLIDGIQYALPDYLRYARDTVLFDDAIVLLNPYDTYRGRGLNRIETYSMFGGKINKPWTNTPVDEQDGILITDGHRLVIISEYARVKILSDKGVLHISHLKGLDSPTYSSSGKSHRRRSEGKLQYMPHLDNGVLFQERLYVFLISSNGRHFVCEYDLEGTMLRAWQVDRAHELNKWVNAMAIVLVDEVPHIYAYRQTWGEVPSPGEIMLYTPVPKSENAEAVQ